MLSIKSAKKDFPIFNRQINGHQLVYLDSAATSQKPQAVIDSLVDYYQNHNANVHRGIHTLGDESTKMYDAARQTIAEFIGVEDKRELIFVRNTTEAINLVAYAWGENNIKQGDEILLTEAEHHSNIVPWQLVADRKKAKLYYIEVDKQGKLDLEDLRRKLSSRTKLVSVVHVSNFLGTINPIREIAKVIRAKSQESRQHLLLLVDGAQAVPHMPVDVKELGCDFYAFSGHKMYGPMGIGCLWGRRKILESMPPFLTGGGMINTVSKDKTIFTDLPDKFEAGTPNVAGAVGLAAAVKYLQKIGMERVRKHEVELTEYAMRRLSNLVIPSPAGGGTWGSDEIATAVATRRPRNDSLTVEIYGPKGSKERGGLIAFTVKVDGKEVHGHDVAQVLDSQGIAVRSGHHCVMPMHAKLGLAATTRISFGIYNTKGDVDRLVEALGKIQEVFGM